jgi:P-type Ca2+ transporter type 2C
MEAFRKGIKETITSHQVDVQNGLSSQQVTQSRQENGANVFDAEKKVSLFKKILLSLNDVATIILLIAAVISFVATYLESSGNYFESL